MRIEIELPPLVKNELAAHISYHDPRRKGPIMYIEGKDPDDPNSVEHLTLGFDKRVDFINGKPDEYWVCRPEHEKDRVRVQAWEARLREWQR